MYETATIKSVSRRDLVKHGFRSFRVKADRVIARSGVHLIKPKCMVRLQCLCTVDNCTLSFSVD